MHHDEVAGFVSAPPDRVFAHLDDHARLSAHMSKPSWRMGGGRMRIELDGAQGKAVGSRIRLAGRVFGLELAVQEIVVERSPPFRKVWETEGAPRLLVIGRYRMGFESRPQGEGTALRVFIDYTLPDKAPARWLGRLMGRRYARWCTRQMLADAVKRFAAAGPAHVGQPGGSPHDEARRRH